MKKILLSLSALLISMAGMAANAVTLLDGTAEGLTSTATAAETIITQNDFSYTISTGGKKQASSGTNKFEGMGDAILIGKSGAYIYNNTPFGEGIESFELYSNKGASAKVSVSVSFSVNPITAEQTAEDSIWTATLSTVDNIYAVTVPAGARYFYYKVTNANNSQVAFRITYSLEEGIVLKPTISGVEHFADSTVVTLEAEEGRKIFYTLDGTDPDTASTAYTAPFVLRDSAMVKAVAYNDTTKKFSEVSDKLFCKHTLVSCVEAAALADGEWAFMKPFDVVYVVDGKGYIYIQDETGVMLIYSYDLTSSLKAGDHVEGMVGTSSPYNGLPEIKPTVTAEDLTITEGEVIAPKEYTAMPMLENVNEYVVLKGVTIADTIGMTTSAVSYPIAWANDTIVLRNQFKYVDTLALNTYDIYGFVGVYNSELQIYYLNAVPYVQITVTVNDSTLGTVTGAGAYAIGSEVTLTATPNDKCEFVNWSNESTENPLTFIAEEDVTLTANFQEIAEGITHTQVATKVEKVVENGQVIIIKNGIRYSALGVEL